MTSDQGRKVKLLVRIRDLQLDLGLEDVNLNQLSSCSRVC